LDLAQAPGLWRVAAGRIELYALAMADGRQIGNRFLVQAMAMGDLLVASPAAPGSASPAAPDSASPAAPGCRLLAFAVGPARLERIAAPTPAMLDGWVGRLSDVVAEVHGRHQGGQLLLAEDQVSLNPGAELRGGREPIWAEVVEGGVVPFGGSAGLFPAGHVIPLTATAWFTAGPDGAVLAGMATARLLERPGWMTELTTWQNRMLVVLVDGLLAREAAEAARVQRTVQWSRDLLRATQSGVADTLTGRPAQPIPSREDPLVAVCRIVARSMGFELPEQPARPAAQPLGPLERIVRNTRTPARQVTLQGGWWRDQLGPMIAFLREDGRPVAVLPERRGRYALHDPVTGDVRPLTREVAVQLDPSAYVLYPPLPDRKLRARDLLRFGLAHARNDVALMLVAGLIGSLLGLAIPAATAVLVDEFIPSRLDTQLLQMGALMLLAVAVMVVVQLTQDMAQLRIAGRGANRLQPAVMDRTIRLPIDFLNRFTSADLAERVRVIDAIRAGLDTIVIDAMLTGVFSLTSILFLFVLAPPLAAVAVLLTIPILIAAIWASKAQLPALAMSEARGAETAQLVYQLIDNISHLRSAGAEERAFARWGRLYREYQVALLRASRVGNRLSGFTTAYGIIGLALFFLALQAFRSAEMSVGEMVMIVSVYGNFIASATGFAGGLQQVFHLQPKLERARPLLAAEPEVDVTRLDPGELSGRIEVNHLTFGYPGAVAPVLRDISLAIEPGSLVALVGPSGCGKSTLLKLLLGFEQPAAGSVLYDGRDLKRLDMRAVRRQIGTVLQSDRLMSGTLFENILGVSGRGNEDAWQAARQAGIAEEIEAMPMGMHTLLTDGGSTLSGGQVQRVLIARALIGSPRIIFFDEATSALDNRSQAIVMHSLERMAVTRVVIAHRLSTVRNADRIIVMDSGNIVQSGRYDELIAVPGLFADLIRRQESA
jgi:NHLM bacteriocin system ABC transporter ATP-binding protein